MNLSEQTPAQIDGELFPILEKLARAEQYRDNYRRLAEEAQAQMDETGFSPQLRSFNEGLAKYEEQVEELDRQALPFEAEYNRRGGWTRYIVVPRGHLHRRSCSTLTPGRTMVGQVAEASGMTDEQVVEHFKITACTHCFPDAPVAPKLTPEQEGFCPMSGRSIHDEPELAGAKQALVDRYGEGGWHSFAMARSIRCTCGGYPALTKGDKVRKHKPGSPKL